MTNSGVRAAIAAVRGGILIGSACIGVVASAGAMEPIADTIESIRQMSLQEAAAFIGGQVTPIWLDDGSRFLFTENGPEDLGIWLADPISLRFSRLASDAKLRPALEDATDIRGPELHAHVNGLSADGRVLYVEAGSRDFAVDPTTLQVRVARERASELARHRPRVISDQFPTTFGNLVEAAAPDGKKFITVKDSNLYVRAVGENGLKQLTQDGSPRLTWFNTQESAQSFNVFWNPDSRRIAAVQLDTREVWHEPLLHLLGHPRIEYVAYPRAGEPMHRFNLAIFDVDSGHRTPIDTGDTTDHYVDLLGWRSDGKAVFYQTVDREQKELQIFAADAATGKRSLLLRETAATYLDTRMTLGSEFFFALRKSNGFIYLSERDGWRHLYLYDGEGGLVRRLTSGSWAVNDVVAIDEAHGWAYFRAGQNPAAPYDLQLFRVSLQGGEPQRLTEGSGTNQIAMSPSLRFFVATRSSPQQPPMVELRAVDGRLLRVLSRTRIDQLIADGFSGVESFVTKSVDGRWEMHGIIMKPYHFDPGQRYPVVEIIYGGMQSINTPHEFFFTGGTKSSLTLRSLIHAGFTVVVADAPGTPGRGKAFQDVTYGTWPQGVIDNHVHWIEAAAGSRPWMDLKRVGVYGHSWGGYMAERAMIDAPQLYKVAVEHAGPSDFVDHPTYIEPFMGLPQHNAAGYEAGSNLTRVERIEGPVLVMTMPLDVNAGFSPGMKFVDAMMSAKKDVDLAVFPESNHRMNCCGVERELYGIAMVQRYLRAHLLPPSESAHEH